MDATASLRNLDFELGTKDSSLTNLSLIKEYRVPFT